ncbi:putative protein YcgM [Pseudoalteromonas holothuriae]|uniref:Fumarylacetoacetase-like C-terminal domain-containing protein n=1 Tax=Pseudoalteromonas holothuriae TaxID=2963714 RepID=A0A9W4VUR1_9GAMM|nr:MULTISPECIES: fumarylacetoacetate hydrolase family protein [unclassified Pseudoalteromonas]CAH9064400.1 putative protein YcgM [Pseudoalteromonas sp. CIP111854]CAH9065352.1 putative protein YcgM [Pseudoalteromonas sp. CIP111951]
MYKHHWVTGQEVNLAAGKVVCIGRNYAAHAQELNNPIPLEPLIFMKPNTSFQSFDGEVELDSSLGAHHYEAEVALLIGEKIDKHSISVINAVVGIGLALDLTLRAEQTKLKKQGYPWERAKSYDGSCPITAFVPVNSLAQLNHIEFRFWQNDELMQHGHSNMMIFSFEQLLTNISQFCTLLPGDVILTGTPEGVGKLEDNSRLCLQLNDGPRHYAQISFQ